ncbi:hypothetical protein [Acinetobacter sp. Ver3]|uniref:hypothetical protein n=1 Tax=Acinetobacter sp. Ver3 TaxID=466088 RepID=UPI000446DC32|nr:hypothetical protein [Acinetobacter sp. Ver3]EZQ10738.1 hypothetical protein CL42_06290 [Acinetobacter sp. Ver3]
MMTLSQAERVIYTRIGQFIDRSKYMVGADIHLIGQTEPLGKVETGQPDIDVIYENSPPHTPPKNKLWCKVYIDYANSLVAELADNPLVRHNGLIQIQCFAPLSSGTLPLLNLCDEWLLLLQSFSEDDLEIHTAHAPARIDDLNFLGRIIRAEFRVN